jgi:signal-transduction protein with cAMP-binding, CBS, and nucleotidyltransferase domain
MSFLEQKSFIKSISPFDKLDNHSLEEITKELDIVYF